jgi:predicted metal-dependent peptidase
MGRRKRDRTAQPPPPHRVAWRQLEQHPMFAPLTHLVTPLAARHYARAATIGPGGWAVMEHDGGLWIDDERKGAPEEWRWVFAYLLVQLGLGHFPVRPPAAVWVAAADLVTERFLAPLKIGHRPSDLAPSPDLAGREVERVFEQWRAAGVPPAAAALGVAGRGRFDLVGDQGEVAVRFLASAERALADGLAAAVASAIEVASGRVQRLGETRRDTPAQRAQQWLITAYPLLGGLAAGMELVEDPEACRSLDIAIAAVDPGEAVIYVNPHAGLDDEEARFVLAHELLHAGLRHDLRRQGRDPFLWNVACDYVINGWLVQMQLGHMPERGCLHDPSLDGLSAEEVYDRIAGDLRRLRKLATLRGQGACDVLEAPPEWWRGDGCDLDAFYRRALCTGLDTHVLRGRGFVPAHLVEAIRVLAHPPLPWDVALAQWFDRWFQPVERRRTYARPSRRQGSTPDIPRPRYVEQTDALAGRTFGVVLDTSGSMDPALLGRALGAIASYAASRDVPAARIVFCDAAAYDQGYVPVESIAQRVRVKGRGGTVLQPGIDLLERAADFPRDGPILVITDAQCDVLRVRREHAFLVPEGARLPFRARGPVFRIAAE